MTPPPQRQIIKINSVIPVDLSGLRLDQALAKMFPAYSRSCLQQWLKKDYVIINNQLGKPRYLVKGNEKVFIEAEITEQSSWSADAIDLEVIYEDEDLMVINKPAGLVVHPGAGNHENTLVNGLLHHLPEQKLVPRAGLIHRLDKDTTGLLIVAKNLTSHQLLVNDLKERNITRLYQCIVNGHLVSGNTINAPLGRDVHNRLRRKVVPNGKDATTHYRIGEQFRNHTHLFVRLETGRTHQIRAHMSHIGHPIVGDKLYRGFIHLPSNPTTTLIESLQKFKRPALHAYKLILTHPQTKKIMSWEQCLPNDMLDLLAALKEDKLNDERT